MSTELKTRIKLRKDLEANWVSANPVLLDGEISIVNAGSKGLRIKLGNGTSKFNELQYLDADSTFKQSIVIGYYFEGNFYTDTIKSVKYDLYGHQLYIDYISGNIYYYTGENLEKLNLDLPKATSETAGIVKLYSVQGQNEDGTITQKFFTQVVDSIAFGVEEKDAECLILNKPW